MSNKSVLKLFTVLTIPVATFFIASVLTYSIMTFSVQAADHVEFRENIDNSKDSDETAEAKAAEVVEKTADEKDVDVEDIENIINAEIIYPPAKNQKSPLGINTNEIFEQDASIPFVDLFRVATPFHENIRCRRQDMPCLSSAKVEYDEQGWPKKLNGGKAGAFFIRNIAIAGLPEGDYKVLYDGEGKIEYLQNVELVQREKGEDTIRFNAREDGFMTAALQIVDSNPEKPLRNIRIIMPGGICQNNPFKQVSDAESCKDVKYLDFKNHYASIIFNPDYLNYMKDFEVIRFMPMSGITRNPAEKWEQRPKLDKATWGGYLWLTGRTA